MFSVLLDKNLSEKNNLSLLDGPDTDLYFSCLLQLYHNIIVCLQHLGHFD